MNNNKDLMATCDSEGATRPKLCYTSVAALFLAVFTALTPSGIRDLIVLNMVASIVAAVSLIRIRYSDSKLRGKGLAIAAITISLGYMLFLIVVLVIRKLENL